MKRLLPIVLCLTWALWFGGLIALFIFVQTLFAQSRPLAMQGAPLLFLAFERYELFLGIVALIAAIGWRWLVRSRLLTLLVILLILAAVGVIVSSAAITSPMEQLRLAGQSGSAEFKRLHGYSMMVYVAQAVVLLIAGLILPSILMCAGITAAALPPRQTDSETAPG
ncbi:MAG TPA: hypothetical protein VHP11_00680 [Tepidisphaeraceae bacterium]|nr:hypothetical protein [Tepidisphaeraceae bacterium]